LGKNGGKNAGGFRSWVLSLSFSDTHFVNIFLITGRLLIQDGFGLIFDYILVIQLFFLRVN